MLPDIHRKDMHVHEAFNWLRIEETSVWMLNQIDIIFYYMEKSLFSIPTTLHLHNLGSVIIF